MNENHEVMPELLEDLRAVASEGPREAPPYIEARILAEFRRRKRRRNLRIWGPSLGLAAAAALVALLLGGKPSPAKKPAAVALQSAVSAPDDDSDAGFYPLPEAEALPPVENAMVVRVQLPVSSLQLMGVPIDQERADSSVQADLLLGQDGLARAVRLAP
jgi:hypothetical protein